VLVEDADAPDAGNQGDASNQGDPSN
jgi:hypothetical protein